jgi:hypothetical protein
MLRHRLTSAVLMAALVVLPAVASGCGQEEHTDEPRREGLFIDLAGLEYNVYLTRQLNPRDAEDADYLPGTPEPPPGDTYYGVFINVCNVGGDDAETIPSARSFRIVDTQENEFEPLRLPEDNVFAYRAEPVEPHRCNPVEGSAAASGPTGGALLVFQLPTSAAENRPLELEIRPQSGTGEIARFELDI